MNLALNLTPHAELRLRFLIQAQFVPVDNPLWLFQFSRRVRTDSSKHNMRKEHLLSRPACLGSDCLVSMFICSALEFAKSILNSQQHILPMLSDSNCYKGTQFRFCFARFVLEPIGPDVRLLVLTQVGDLPFLALTRPSLFSGVTLPMKNILSNPVRVNCLSPRSSLYCWHP